jgi:hypothetical protein
MFAPFRAEAKLEKVVDGTWNELVALDSRWNAVLSGCTSNMCVCLA